MKCPVCNKVYEKEPMLCTQCGWDFPVYGSWDKELEAFDRDKKRIIERNWKDLVSLRKKLPELDRQAEESKMYKNNYNLLLRDIDTGNENLKNAKKEVEDLKEKLGKYKYLGSTSSFVTDKSNKTFINAQIEWTNNTIYIELKSAQKNNNELNISEEIQYDLQFCMHTELEKPNPFDIGTFTFFKHFKGIKQKVDLKELPLKGDYFVFISAINYVDSKYFFEALTINNKIKVQL